MNVKILNSFMSEFGHKDIDKKFYALLAYKKIKTVGEVDHEDRAKTINFYRR